MNIIILSGNITKDAEIKTFGDKNVITFSIAVTKGFGEKASTMFVNCKLWGSEKQAGTLTKGTKITLKGELSIRKHEDKYYTEVVVDGYNGYELGAKRDKAVESPTKSNDIFESTTFDYEEPTDFGDSPF